MAALLLGASGCAFDEPPGGTADSGALDPRDSECGDLGCNSGFFVSIVPSLGFFAAGRYDINARSPTSELLECSFVLAADEGRCGGDPPCVVANSCDASFHFVLRPYSVSLRLPAQERALILEIRHEGEPVLQEQFDPSFVEYFPNGSDCQPTCLRGDATVEL